MIKAVKIPTYDTLFWREIEKDPWRRYPYWVFCHADRFTIKYIAAYAIYTRAKTLFY